MITADFNMLGIDWYYDRVFYSKTTLPHNPLLNGRENNVSLRIWHPVSRSHSFTLGLGYPGDSPRYLCENVRGHERMVSYIVRHKKLNFKGLLGY